MRTSRAIHDFIHNKDGQMGMVENSRAFVFNTSVLGCQSAAVGLLITLIIVVLIYYNIAASIDVTSVDAKLPGTPAANATTAINNQAATFFTIAPIENLIGNPVSLWYGYRHRGRCRIESIPLKGEVLGKNRLRATYRPNLNTIV